jgi:hypothetical protein
MMLTDKHYETIMYCLDEFDFNKVHKVMMRKSVEEGKADRIAELLEEAANEIERLRNERTNQ